MRPNDAGRFSDFARNSCAVTSMSMLYSLSLCTCRTARWWSRCWLIELRKYVFSEEKLRSTKKLRGTNTLLVPNPKVGGLVSPGPRGCCAYEISYATRYVGGRLTYKEHWRTWNPTQWFEQCTVWYKFTGRSNSAWLNTESTKFMG